MGLRDMARYQAWREQRAVERIGPYAVKTAGAYMDSTQRRTADGGICGGRDSFCFFADNPAEPAYLASPGKSDQRTPLVIASAKDLAQANFGYSEYVEGSPKPAQLVRLRLNRPSAGPVGPKMDTRALTTLGMGQDLTCRKEVVERLPELCGPHPSRRRWQLPMTALELLQPAWSRAGLRSRAAAR